MLHQWAGAVARHDQGMLLAAVLVGFTGLLMTLRLYGRALSAEDRKPAWVAVSAISAGATTWAAHFIAMTAYQPHLQSGYEPVRTTFAFMTAVAGMAGAFWAGAAGRRVWTPALAGGLYAIGASAALSASLNAFQIQGALSWDPLPLLLATPIGVGLAVIAFTVGRDFAGWKRPTWTALLLSLSAAVIHMGGIAGVTVAAAAGGHLANDLIPPGVLALIVTLAAGLTIAAGFIALDASGTNLFSVDQARLRQIIDAVPEAVGYCDPQDRLVFWNTRYADLGRDSSMPMRPGTRFRDILESALARGGYKSAVGREQAWLDERMAQHHADHSVHEHPLNDGRWMRIEERRTAEGGVVMVLVDITDLKRDAEVLENARDAAIHANRAKSEFLANMSHEIRTPLNGVIGLTDVLARTALDRHQQEIVDIIRASGATLERLLSDVLDLARIDSGRLEIRQEAYALHDVVHQVAGLAGLRAADKGVAFELDMHPSANATVDGDPDRLKQILFNLLSNAVKFTQQGKVTMTVSPIQMSGEAGFRFAVSDTGVGFSMEDKSRLFQRFEQADGSITRRFGGSGLGLAIAYQLTSLMGGVMDANAVEGEGATFVVDLPLLASAPALDVEGVPALDTIDDESAAPRILLAEDHPTNRKVVELLLEPTGAELTSVENGALAVEAFRAAAFDVVLMDMQMPVMDGLAAIRCIRDFERAEGRVRTPIVSLTANALAEHVEASLAAGADAHIAKPITAMTLLPAIARLLHAAAEGDDEAAAPRAATAA